MTVKFEEYYLGIGYKALEYAEGLAGPLMVFADVADGAISCSLFYLNEEGYLRLRFAPPHLREFVYRFWEEWQKEPGNHVWRELIYLVDDTGKFTMDLIYPDMIDPNDVTTDRREMHVKKYLGDIAIDYSQPGWPPPREEPANGGSDD
jgi:hypothetical protein